MAKTGKVVGIRSFDSKSGKKCNIAYFEYEDEKDKYTRGNKVGECFVSDEIMASVGKRDIIGLTCIVSGHYVKDKDTDKAVWTDYIKAIS